MAEKDKAGGLARLTGNNDLGEFICLEVVTPEPETGLESRSESRGPIPLPGPAAEGGRATAGNSALPRAVPQPSERACARATC